MGGVFKISDENCNETEEFNNTDILFVNFLILMTVLFVIVWGICCYSLLTVWKRRAFRFKESKSNGTTRDDIELQNEERYEVHNSSLDVLPMPDNENNANLKGVVHSTVITEFPNKQTKYKGNEKSCLKPVPPPKPKLSQETKKKGKVGPSELNGSFYTASQQNQRTANYKDGSNSQYQVLNYQKMPRLSYDAFNEELENPWEERGLYDQVVAGEVQQIPLHSDDFEKNYSVLNS